MTHGCLVAENVRTTKAATTTTTNCRGGAPPSSILLGTNNDNDDDDSKASFPPHHHDVPHDQVKSSNKNSTDNGVTTATPIPTTTEATTTKSSNSTPPPPQSTILSLLIPSNQPDRLPQERVLKSIHPHHRHRHNSYWSSNSSNSSSNDGHGGDSNGGGGGGDDDDDDISAPDATRSSRTTKYDNNDNNSSITCQIQIECCYNSDNDNTDTDTGCCWMVTGFDRNGQRKTIGGDEYYIRYEEILQTITKKTKLNMKSKRTRSRSSRRRSGDSSKNNSEPVNETDEEECVFSSASTTTTTTEIEIETKTLLSAVALITDLDNGTYKLEFVTTPMNPNIILPPPLSPGEGCRPRTSDSSTLSLAPSNRTATDESDECSSSSSQPFADPDDDSYECEYQYDYKLERILTVYFEYSNGIGYMHPPMKNSWSDGGYTHTKYTVSNIPLPRPCIRQFQPPLTRMLDFSPSSSTSHKHQQQTNFVFLNHYDTVLVFGDSSYCQFVRQRPNKKGKYYFQNNLKVGEKIRIPLNTNTVSTFLQLLDEQHGTILRSSCCCSDSGSKKIALLMGSSLWDILDSYDTIQNGTYEDHKVAMRELIQSIQKLYPDVVIYWKLPTAVHIHVVDLERLQNQAVPPSTTTTTTTSPVGSIDPSSKDENSGSKPSSTSSSLSSVPSPPLSTSSPTLFGIDRVRYMSGSRSHYLYKLQKQLLDEEFVQQDHSSSDGSGGGGSSKLFYLDLYEATYLSADQLYPSDGRHYRPDLNRLMLSWFYN